MKTTTTNEEDMDQKETKTLEIRAASEGSKTDGDSENKTSKPR